MVRPSSLLHGDVLDAGTLTPAFEGCDAVYYLVHSIGTGKDFAATEATAARNVATRPTPPGYAASCTSVAWAAATHSRRIWRVGTESGRFSPQLRTPTTELRAAVIIGSGSISFEMLRYLTEVLPVMVTPRWVHTRCQPIAIRDVLYYLTALLQDPEPVDRVMEIGGPDVVTYAEMMQTYAEVAGLRRRLIVPTPPSQPPALVAMGRPGDPPSRFHRRPSH